MIWKSGSEIRRLKLTLFLCNLRVKSPAELEAILQNWTPGKESGIWLHVSIVLALCPGVTGADFLLILLQEPCVKRILCARSTPKSALRLHIRPAKSAAASTVRGI